MSDAGADTDVDTIRLEDYLDDRLQSAADLFPSTVQSASQHGKDSEADAPVLTALLASVDVQRVQLERQLDEATRALAAAQNSGADRAREVAVRVQEFRELQVRVDARMKELRALIGEEGEAVDETKKVEAVGVDEDGLDAWGGGVDEEDGSGDIGGGPEVQDKTSRQASEAAVTTRRHLEQTIARLERPLAQLRRVRLTQAYLELLRDAEALRSEARQGTPSQTAADDSNKDARTRAAVAAYVRLRRLSRALAETAAGGGGGGPQAAHLVAYIESATATVWEELKTSMTGELRAVLEKRKWPTAIDPEKAGEEEGEAMDDEWRACCERLLELQMPELLASLDEGQGRGGGGSGGGGWKVTTLLPFDVMAQTFVDAFRYHFMSRDRPTGDPRAVGTYCFPWFLSLVERWAAFFRASMGPLLAEKFAGAGHAANMLVYMDPVCAFITSMLPVVREKVAAVMQEAALGDPAFLSSFMGQLMTFDETIRTRFDYDSGDAEKGWGGLTSEVLDKHFDAWLTAEKDFALARFREIRSSKEARNIDYEYNGPGKMKPTYGAVRVTDLLRSVTTQYERIRRFSHKLRFLIDIQIAILDEYHDLLRDSLEAYYSMTSAVGRTLHGVTKEQLAELEGTGALETLCKVIGSADHIINSLRDWSNEEVRRCGHSMRYVALTAPCSSS